MRSLRIAVALFALSHLPVEAQTIFGSSPKRVSLNFANQSLNGPVSQCAVSDDGQVVMFVTSATNVLPTPPTGSPEFVYLRNSSSGQVTFVGSAAQSNNNFAQSAYLSADGRYVLFRGGAENVSGAPAGTFAQAFLFDATSGALELISRNSSGSPSTATLVGSNGLSADGRFVLYHSNGTDVPGVAQAGSNGVQLYRLDRTTGVHQAVIVDASGSFQPMFVASAALSTDGALVGFNSLAGNLVSGDTNGVADLFVRDMTSSAIERISVSSSGVQGNGSSSRTGTIADDGRFVVFGSFSNNLDDAFSGGGITLYYRDRVLNETHVVAVDTNGKPAGTSLAFGVFEIPQFDSITHRAYFATASPLLPPGDGPVGLRQVALRDLDSQTVAYLSVGPGGVLGNGDSFYTRLSRNGNHLVFLSNATTFDPTDTNAGGNGADVYQIDLDCVVLSATVGVGTPGTLGITPLLTGTSLPCAMSASFAAVGGLGGAPALLAVGIGSTLPAPVGGGQIYFDVSKPFALLPMPNLGIAGVPGAGSWIVSTSLTFLSGNTLMLQGFFLDPNASGGFSATAGLRLDVE